MLAQRVGIAGFSARRHEDAAQLRKGDDDERQRRTEGALLVRNEHDGLREIWRWKGRPADTGRAHAGRTGRLRTAECRAEWGGWLEGRSDAESSEAAREGRPACRQRSGQRRED